MTVIGHQFRPPHEEDRSSATRDECKGEDVPKRVLVVEDEQDVADLVADILDLEGFQVQLASGESAMTMALSFRPHVVLLDLMMPIVDGFEVARRLHAEPTTRNLPIVVMTAMRDASAGASRIGTQHVLAKPFNIDDLLHTLDAAIQPA